LLQWLTPAERRGASVLVLILLLGAGHDACLARRMRAELAARSPAAEIPRPGSAPIATASPGAAGPSADGRDAKTLDLNRADARDLEALPGIGPVLAARIIAFRQRQGSFGRVEELLGVRGVGPRLYERLQPHVRVAAPAADRRGAGVAPGAMQSAPLDPNRRADSASVGRGASR